MKKRVTLALVALAAVLLLVSIGRGLVARSDAAPDARDVAAASRTATPKIVVDERNPLVAGALVAGNGIVEPADRETKVAGSTAGRVARVVVKEGDRVRAGDPLVELESDVERAALDALEADVAAASAELARTSVGDRQENRVALDADADGLRARSMLSAKDVERTERLVASGALARAELDAAKAKADADRAALAALESRKRSAERGRPEDVTFARARVSSAVARRDQAKKVLDRLVVRAPSDGEILAIKIRPGEYYAPGQPNAEPLLVMGDTRTLRVRMDVDERDVAKVKLGQRAFATLVAFPDTKFAGKVVEIGRRIGRKNVRTDDPVERLDTKILEVVFELERPSGLVPGQRVTAYVEG